MKRTKRGLTAAVLCALVTLSGCQSQSASQATPVPETTAAQQETATAVSAAGTYDLFSDRDLAGTYDESQAVQIQLNGDSAACDSAAVTIQNGQITIGAEGVYLISGTLTDGQIIVNAGDTDKVQLVLAGADITSSTSAAIYALEADKVFVTLAEGTENTLTNGGEYIAIDDNNIDAVIFSKTDLTLNGSGSLTINAQAGHGVVSKDDLVITGGSYTITAASHGLSGKDSIAIAAGTFTITSGKDGIHAENSDDLTLGTLYIADGSFSIHAQGDGVSAQGALQIDGGTFTLNSGDDAVHCDAALTIQSGTFTIPYCYEGIEGLSITIEDGIFDIVSSDDGLNAAGGADSSGFGGFGGRPQDTFASDSDSFIIINGGTFTVTSSGDCIDANGDLTLNGGTLTLTCNGAGDTALDCDGTYTNNGGDITTNDGSESNPGQMGGGMGGGMGGQRPDRQQSGTQQAPAGT